jgi:anti-sigma B factor antagonist
MSQDNSVLVVREPHDETAVLHLEGPLRTPVSARLRPKVRALLGRGTRKIVLNLAGVSDVDAAGLGELVEAHNMAVAANGMLRITHAAGRVRELLARVALLERLHIERERPSRGEILPLDPPT